MVEDGMGGGPRILYVGRGLDAPVGPSELLRTGLEVDPDQQEPGGRG
jgi:hypothetical protein